MSPCQLSDFFFLVGVSLPSLHKDTWYVLAPGQGQQTRKNQECSALAQVPGLETEFLIPVMTTKGERTQNVSSFEFPSPRSYNACKGFERSHTAAKRFVMMGSICTVCTPFVKTPLRKDILTRPRQDLISDKFDRD